MSSQDPYVGGLLWAGGWGCYSANHTAQTHAARKATLPPHTCTPCSKDQSKRNQFNDGMLHEVVVPPTMAGEFHPQSLVQRLTLVRTREWESKVHSERIKQAQRAKPGPRAHVCVLVRRHPAHSISSARARRASCAVTPAKSAALSSLT